MDIEQALLEQVRNLSPQARQEVLDFAAFLRQKDCNVLSGKARIPGLHQHNTYSIADDFDAPLPDEFWLGNT